MTAITLNALKKDYGQSQILHGIDLRIEEGELVVLLGPSGCGKSTLLKLIAGLEPVTDGQISIGDTVVNDLPPGKRDLALVFQSYALYPHMTVAENIGFSLRMAKLPQDEIARRTEKAARTLRIETLLDRYPRQLSGGQRQRTAIARAIAREPRVILFDEPLSNLDAELRAQTRVEIARLHKELAATIVFVTHDQVEALTLADRIVLLNAGRIEQVGRPLDLYNDPDTLFAASFIGSPTINTFPGPQGETLAIRPEHIRITGEGRPRRSARVDLVEHLGDVAIVHFVDVEGQRLTAKLPPSDAPNAGDLRNLFWSDDHVLRFDKAGHRLR
jgi:ABC-type sugar transport system ATPase subunit